MDGLARWLLATMRTGANMMSSIRSRIQQRYIEYLANSLIHGVFQIRLMSDNVEADESTGKA